MRIIILLLLLLAACAAPQDAILDVQAPVTEEESSVEPSLPQEFLSIDITDVTISDDSIESVTFEMTALENASSELLLYVYDQDADVKDILPLETYYLPTLKKGQTHTQTLTPDIVLEGVSDKVLRLRFKDGTKSQDAHYAIAMPDLPEPQEEIIITDKHLATIVSYTVAKKSENFMVLDNLSLRVVNSKDVAASYKLKFYLYGERDDPYFKRSPRQEFDFGEIPAGKSKTLNYKVSISFNNITEEKTVLLRLLDASKRIVEDNEMKIAFSD